MRNTLARTGLRVVFTLLALLGGTSVARAQWTTLDNSLPSGHTFHCLLLTDATVMCHEDGTNKWHRLVPDQNGSYVHGTWDPNTLQYPNIQAMPNGSDSSVYTDADMDGNPEITGPCAPCMYAPTFYSSAVLPDGRVLVIGGEYNTNGNTWTNIGFLYNPVANSWSAQINEPFGTGNIGDSQNTILPDGTLLLSNISTRNMASFNPNVSPPVFTAINPTGKLNINDEEGWNILPDGTVLTVGARNPGKFEIYDPATNVWTTGNTPVNLPDAGTGTGNSSEVGPGVLRPDGTLVYFSGNPSGQNAVYNTNTGMWSHTASMDFPTCNGEGPCTLNSQHFSVADGPATLLPNGNVLVMASPVTALPKKTFNTPSHFYEFDGTNLTAVTDAPNASSFKSYQGNFLVLPTGEALLAAWNQGGTSTLAVYSNGGGPQNAWRPVITLAPANVQGGGSYSISGKLFNGFSEGASYGDDAQMSTNYPIVRITNHATGHVFYARTHDHSRMGVEPVGSNEIVDTTFEPPAALESGPSDLVVIANGIASTPIVVNGVDLTIEKTHAPTLFTQGDSGDTFTITVGNNGKVATSGVVTVVDALPPSLVATTMAGSGWSCNVGTLTCTTNSVRGPGGVFPDITVTVDVASDAPILVTNTATVSGGGEASSVNVTSNDTASEPVNVRQHTTTTVSAATQDYHDDVTLTAVVAPPGVSGGVEFRIDGVFVGAGTYVPATGAASLVWNINVIPGPHTIRADFTSSDPLYLDSFGTNTLTVTREETTTTYTGPTAIANGLGVTLRGVLKEDGIVPIAGRTVFFTLGAGVTAQTCNGATDASGVATCMINPVMQPLGPGTVAAAFAGDAYYLPSSQSASTILFAFLANGAFAVGDLSAAGNPVTFWGSQWSTINVLSGGPAPSAFVGFANTTAEPPACVGGVAWTSQNGGNSAVPPQTVPSYMGVIVPTMVVKSGSVLSGDILKIVVVQTAPGYAPSPGHAGTGQIVATYCVRP